MARLTSITSKDQVPAKDHAIFDQIVAYAQGTPRNVVNPEVLTSPALRRG